jgi:hypothetical protein
MVENPFIDRSKYSLHVLYLLISLFKIFKMASSTETLYAKFVVLREIRHFILEFYFI